MFSVSSLCSGKAGTPPLDFPASRTSILYKTSVVLATGIGNRPEHRLLSQFLVNVYLVQHLKNYVLHDAEVLGTLQGLFGLCWEKTETGGTMPVP